MAALVQGLDPNPGTTKSVVRCKRVGTELSGRGTHNVGCAVQDDALVVRSHRCCGPQLGDVLQQAASSSHTHRLHRTGVGSGRSPQDTVQQCAQLGGKLYTATCIAAQDDTHVNNRLHVDAIWCLGVADLVQLAADDACRAWRHRCYACASGQEKVAHCQQTSCTCGGRHDCATRHLCASSAL